MAENIKRHITHIKSKVIENSSPKLPTAAQIELGEIAVNYAKDVETLSIKNESGTVVTFSSDNYYTEKKLGSGFTGSNSARTVTDVIEENELITSAALNDLETNKLTVSAYTEDTSKLGETTHYLTGVTGAAGGTNLAASWSGSSSEIDELYTGLTVKFIIPSAGHKSGDTLSINDGEKHAIFYNASDKLTIHYSVGSVLTLTYDADTTGSYYSGSSTQASVQGVWRTNAEYYKDTNTDVIGYYTGHNQVVYKTDAAAYRYMLLLKKDETTLTPVNTTSNSTAGTKTLTTSEFDPFGDIIYKSSSATTSANANIPSGATWTQYPLNLAYSFNTTNTLVATESVYIVAVPQSNGKAKLHTTAITQTLPTTEDGLIYIYLGQAYDTTNIYLMNNHPVYYFKDGQIRLYSNSVDLSNDLNAISGAVSANTANIEELSGQTETIAAAFNYLNDNKADKTDLDGFVSVEDYENDSHAIAIALNELYNSIGDVEAILQQI